MADKSKEKPITIDITSLNTSPREEFESLFDRTADIVALIKERLKDIRNIKSCKWGSEREVFDRFSSPDTIVIDGRRGTGKTTHLLTLKYRVESELDGRVKVLEIIDPTSISSKIDILQVFLGTLRRELIAYRKKCLTERGTNKDLRKILEDINKLTKELIKVSRERFLETEEEALETHKDLADLPYKIHQIAKAACEVFGVDSLILPIDDVDMNLSQTHKILTFIKDNFPTPYVIPVVAIDTSQAYAIVKKKKYGFFDIPLGRKPSSENEELRFLDKLPAEWLQKVFPPSKRVLLPDIYQIYVEYLNRKEEEPDIVFEYSLDGKTVELEFTEAISLIFALVYEWNNIKKGKESDSYYVLNYLEGRSIRDFLNDLRALMRGLIEGAKDIREDGEGRYILYNLKYLKERFKPYSLYREVNKLDGVRWFWKRYREVFNRRWKELEGEVRNLKDIVREVLKVADEENEIVSRLEKSFYRLVLQEIYTEKIKIYVYESNGKLKVRFHEDNKDSDSFKKEKMKNLPVVKRYVNVGALIRLVFQTLIPAYIFYWGVKKGYVNYEKFDFGEFADLYASMREDKVKEAIVEFLKSSSVWHKVYSTKKEIPFISVYVARKKHIGRGEVVFPMTELLFSHIGSPCRNDSEYESSPFITVHHPEEPAVPHIYFSPLAFWLKEVIYSDIFGEKGIFVPVVPPFSLGIELVREMVKNFINNLIDGLANFNGFWIGRVYEKSCKNLSGLTEEIYEKYKDDEEKLSELESCSIRLELFLKRGFLDLKIALVEKIQSLKKGEDINKVRKSLEKSFGELKRNLKLDEVEKCIYYTGLKEPKFLRLLEEITDRETKLDSEGLKSKLEQVLEDLSDLSNLEEGLKRLKNDIKTLQENRKNLANELFSSLLLFLLERALIRLLFASLGLPIHHLTVSILSHADVLPKKIHKGFSRYGFRPLYEMDIHFFPTWDPKKDVEEISKSKDFGNSILVEIYNAVKESRGSKKKFFGELLKNPGVYRRLERFINDRYGDLMEGEKREEVLEAIFSFMEKLLFIVEFVSPDFKETSPLKYLVLKPDGDVKGKEEKFLSSYLKVISEFRELAKKKGYFCSNLFVRPEDSQRLSEELSEKGKEMRDRLTEALESFAVCMSSDECKLKDIISEVIGEFEKQVERQGRR